jgi:hypothetical protein
MSAVVRGTHEHLKTQTVQLKDTSPPGRIGHKTSFRSSLIIPRRVHNQGPSHPELLWLLLWLLPTSTAVAAQLFYMFPLLYFLLLLLLHLWSALVCR